MQCFAEYIGAADANPTITCNQTEVRHHSVYECPCLYGLPGDAVDVRSDTKMKVFTQTWFLLPLKKKVGSVSRESKIDEVGVQSN